MTSQFLFLGAATLLLAPSVATAGDAVAKKTYEFSMIKPLPSADTSGVTLGPLHDFRLSVTGGYSHDWRTGAQVPMDRRSRDVSLGLQFGVADTGFASINGQLGSQDIATQPAEFPIDLTNNARFRGVDVVTGMMVMPGLNLGVMGGLGSANASYSFAFDPANELASSGDSRRFGGFANAVIPLSSGLFSGTIGAMRSISNQDYDPGNVPASNTWSSTLGYVDLNLLYSVAPNLRLRGGMAYSRILSEDVADGSVAHDTDWFTLKGGLVADVSPTVQWHLDTSTWLGNDTSHNVRVSTGLTYRF